jgi:alpha-mannosidase
MAVKLDSPGDSKGYSEVKQGWRKCTKFTLKEDERARMGRSSSFLWQKTNALISVSVPSFKQLDVIGSDLHFKTHSRHQWSVNLL